MSEMITNLMFLLYIILKLTVFGEVHTKVFTQTRCWIFKVRFYVFL